MKRSTDRILTTHVGSLIRPPALLPFLGAKEAGKPFDQAGYAKCLRESVAEVVRQQADIGIDVISDGEFGKAISWAQYALFRLGGFERRPFKAGSNLFFVGRKQRMSSVGGRSSERGTAAVQPNTATRIPHRIYKNFYGKNAIDAFRSVIGRISTAPLLRANLTSIASRGTWSARAHTTSQLSHSTSAPQHRPRHARRTN